MDRLERAAHAASGAVSRDEVNDCELTIMPNDVWICIELTMFDA